MDNQSLMKCLDESVGQFNILAERDLIDISMHYIARLQTQETIPTLLSFREFLKQYDLKTKHLYKNDIDELTFKIDQFLDLRLASNKTKSG